jgi:glutathione S-transferase
MIKLYDFNLSGNAHKCRLLLSMLGVEYQTVLVDMTKGAHKAPEFLKINPFGQVPALTDGEVCLRDSGAILVYLAGKYGAGDWLPAAPDELAEIVSWLSFSANEINNGLTAARFAVAFKGPGIDLETAQRRGGHALKLLDAHLEGRQWLALDRPSIADIACYPYAAMAPEGGVSLDRRANVSAWIARFETLPGYLPMPGLPREDA